MCQECARIVVIVAALRVAFNFIKIDEQGRVDRGRRRAYCVYYWDLGHSRTQTKNKNLMHYSLFVI